MKFNPITPVLFVAFLAFLAWGAITYPQTRWVVIPALAMFAFGIGRGVYRFYRDGRRYRAASTDAAVPKAVAPGKAARGGTKSDTA